MKGKFRYTNGLAALALALALWSCDNKNAPGQQHTPSTTRAHQGKQWYTCPMPEDSVFSDKPGKCHKCGMELKRMQEVYTCPMHPEVISGHPGACPICGMDLEALRHSTAIDTMANLVQPTDHFVISQLKPIAASLDKAQRRIAAEGYLTYDPNKASTISTRVSGRIEKLYIRYNFQAVTKGQKLLEIFSEELLTAQKEWLYLIRNSNAEEEPLIGTFKERLRNLGMDEKALAALKAGGVLSPYIPIYATTSGHVHFLNGNTDIASHAFGLPSAAMGSNPMAGEEQQVLREGDYVKQGDPLFAIADESALWALLKVMPSDISNIQQGASVELNVNGSIHEGRVDFIEKSFDDFYTVRVYLQCDDHESLRIGTLVKGYLTAKKRKSNTLWVPTAAVLYLGNSRSAVFVKKELGYQATAVRVGSQTTEWVEIIGGLSVQDSIAPVAAYLVDSEAFINTDKVQ